MKQSMLYYNDLNCVDLYAYSLLYSLVNIYIFIFSANHSLERSKKFDFNLKLLISSIILQVITYINMPKRSISKNTTVGRL